MTNLDAMDVGALRKTVLALREENDDLYREMDALRKHRDAVRALLRQLWIVVESYRSPVTASETIPTHEAR